MKRNLLLALFSTLAAGCGGQASAPPAAGTPVSASPPANAVSVTGTVTDRISGGSIDGSTITFTGLAGSAMNAPIVGGLYIVAVAPQVYDVKISGPANVTHETQSVPVVAAGTVSVHGHEMGIGIVRRGQRRDVSSVLRPGGAGGTIRDTVPTRKWAIPPTELVRGSEPDSCGQSNSLMFSRCLRRSTRRTFTISGVASRAL